MNHKQIIEKRKEILSGVGLDKNFYFKCECNLKIKLEDCLGIGFCLNSKDFGMIYVDFMCPSCYRSDRLFIDTKILDIKDLGGAINNLSQHKIRFYSNIERMGSNHCNISEIVDG